MDEKVAMKIILNKVKYILIKKFQYFNKINKLKLVIL